jgi:hypothetical protein
MEKVENVFLQINAMEKPLVENAQEEMISNVVWAKLVEGVPKEVPGVAHPQVLISAPAEAVVEHA